MPINSIETNLPKTSKNSNDALDVNVKNNTSYNFDVISINNSATICTSSNNIDQFNTVNTGESLSTKVSKNLFNFMKFNFLINFVMKIFR